MSTLPSHSPITAVDIADARRRIAGCVTVTPCTESVALSELTGCQVYCKRDYLQRTGSFKERGAANTLAMLSPEQRQRGVVAASAGNHALALAWHGSRLGVAVTVVMPKFAPLIKAATCRRMGACVISEGDDFEAARKRAYELVEENGLTYVHGFDDPRVIAGQGTVGLEVFEQTSDLDAIIVPVGGAGLIAGVAIAVKAMCPQAEVIGVEPSRMPSFSAALAAGRPVAVEAQPTLADGLAVGCVGANAFVACRTLVDHMIQVDEAALALAVLRLLELEKAAVEGAGAASLAALLSGQLDHLHGKKVALLLCGGNIDPLMLHRVLEHGAAADGRLHRLNIDISDRPGSLAALTRVIADGGASIHDIRHDRMFAGPDMARVRVQVVLETDDNEHCGRIHQRLEQHGFHLQMPELTD